MPTRFHTDQGTVVTTFSRDEYAEIQRQRQIRRAELDAAIPQQVREFRRLDEIHTDYRHTSLVVTPPRRADGSSLYFS